MRSKAMIHLLALMMATTSALAAAPPSSAPPVNVNAGTQPVVIYDAAGNVVSSFGGGSGGASTVTGSQEQDVRSSGTLDATSTASNIVIPLNGQSTVGLRFSGLTASGATVTFEQSNDGGTTYTGVNEVNAGTGVPTATRTTDGQTRVAVQGRTNLRMRISTAGTGTVSVAWNVSVREGLVTLASPLPPGTNNIGTFGLTGPIPAGTNVIGGVTQSGGPWSVSGTVTANLGTIAGAATAAKQPAFGTPGASSTDVLTVQGIAGGTPQPMAAQDNAIAAGAPWTFSANGAQPGFLTTGYNSVAFEWLTGSAVANVESSNDSTDGVNGTWRSVVGVTTGDATAVSGTDVRPTITRRVFPTNTGRWFRINVASYSSGPASVTAVLRNASVAERSVTIGNVVSAALNSSAFTIGGTFAVGTSNTGGIGSISRLPSSAATTNLTSVKASGGRLYKIIACNTTTTSARIKFYNVASGSVTVGTTAVFLSRPIPPAAAAGGLNCSSYDQADIGWSFGTAITYAIVTGAADNDNTAVAAGAITDVSVEYQ